MIRRINTSVPKTASGFTLLEVMIALVIFSIGLLGLAGLQSAGIRNNQLSYARTIATQLAYDMADRIRNNAGRDAAGVLLVSYDAVVANGGTNCLTATCPAATMAAFDRFEWNQAISGPNSPLKNSAGFITQAGGIFTVSIGWDDNNLGALATGCNPATPAGITCISINVIP